MTEITTTFDADAELPVWASIVNDSDGLTKVRVDSEKAFPATLRELDGAVRDQYWVAIARYVIWEDLRHLLGPGLNIVFSAAPQYANAAMPRGKGEEQGQQDAPFAYIRLQQKREGTN